ncbi:toll-like receptor 13 [Pempheris klunzingeri]|uniref:toll-like receptor 13 n=1 Tax=Pempheris klunzingeri TaxID=3127111 RepID=UPI0039805809
MLATGIWPLFLHTLLSFLLGHNPSLAFSLKNCTIVYPENVNSVQVACSDRDLTAIPDDIPRNATSLDLSSNNIVNIKRADLSCLSKVVSALVQYNSISHIDDGAFADLVELRVLIMDENELTNLTDNMFLGLSKLVTISLMGNHISHISPKAFQSLVSIRSVILGSNQLQRITEIAPILKLPYIKDLYLGYNKFASFDTDDLPLNVSNLRFLQMDMNPLTKFSITKDIFPHLHGLGLNKCSCDLEWDVPNRTFLGRLTSLYFAGTDISFEVYRTVLQDATLLQRLSLSTMKTWIDKGLIDFACQIPSLRILDVSDNEIGTVGDNLLRSCSQLTELTLSADGLSGMSDRSLRSMTQLRSLELHRNALSKLPLALRGLSTLEMLDLSSNLISELDCLDFVNLTRLTELNLQRNCILNLRRCIFQPLNDLKVLNIQENYVFILDFKVNLQKLESLKLNNNGHLKLRQGDFGNLSALINLDLDSDTFYSLWEGVFEGLYNLQTLSFRIAYCHKEHFRGLKHLENLTLHLTNDWTQKSPQQNDEAPFSNLYNLKKLVIKVYDEHLMHISPELLKGLKSLEHFMADRFFTKSLHQDTFKYTPRLKGLQISHSDLSCLTPELFWPIPNLQVLDLSSNKLRSLDFLARVQLPGLRWLKLSRNLLTIINETVLQSFPALTYLDLTDNPLTCECSTSGFNQWVQSSNQTQVVNGHQYACAFPTQILQSEDHQLLFGRRSAESQHVGGELRHRAVSHLSETLQKHYSDWYKTASSTYTAAF